MLTLTASAVERLRPLLAQQMANRKSLSDTERLIVWGILFPYAFSMFPFLLFFLIYQMKQWALGWNYLMTTTSNLLMQLIWCCLFTLTLIVLLAMYPPFVILVMIDLDPARCLTSCFTTLSSTLPTKKRYLPSTITPSPPATKKSVSAKLRISLGEGGNSSSVFDGYRHQTYGASEAIQ